MKNITKNITNQPIQLFSVNIENTNENFNLDIRYQESQKAWYGIVSYNNQSVENFRLLTRQSLLYQFQYRYAFDIFLYSDEYIEPSFLNDFSTNKIQFYILTAEERQLFSTDIIDLIEEQNE